MNDSKTLNRRRFLRFAGGGIAATSISACRGSARAHGYDATPLSPPSQMSSTEGEIASKPSTLQQIEELCRPTSANIEGPFFKREAPFRNRLVARDTPEQQTLHLRGRVLGPECQPVAGAVIELWQADAHGAYDNEGHGMRARMRSDAKGGYSMNTIVPGRYLNGQQYRPAHIHVKVHARGLRSLTTQLYFPGDPYNEVDPWYSPLLLCELLSSGERGMEARFDFTLAGAS